MFNVSLDLFVGKGGIMSGHPLHQPVEAGQYILFTQLLIVEKIFVRKHHCFGAAAPSENIRGSFAGDFIKHGSKTTL